MTTPVSVKDRLAPFGKNLLNMCRDRGHWLLVINRAMAIVDSSSSAATHAAVAAFVLAFADHVKEKELLVSIATRKAWEVARTRCATLPPLDAQFQSSLCAGVGEWIARDFMSASKKYAIAVSLASADVALWCDAARLWAARIETCDVDRAAERTTAEMIEAGQRLLKTIDSDSVTAGAVQACIGALHAVWSEHAQARVPFEEAARLCPDDVWTCFFLVATLLECGEHNAAAETLRQARARGLCFATAVDAFDNSPIVSAVYRKQKSLVELLLDVGDVPLDPSWRGEHSALVAAALVGDCGIVELLVKRNACVMSTIFNPVSRDSEDAVEVAVRSGHVDVLESLCALGSLPVTCDVLASAIRGMHDGVPDSDSQSNYRERVRVPTCTSMCEPLRERVLQLLLQKGFPLDGKMERERRPLAMAARAGCLATCRLLWAASGATDDERRVAFCSDQLELSGRGFTYVFDAPMCAAAQSGNVELLAQLHEWTGRRKEQAEATLHFALQLGRVNVARWLRRNQLIWPGFAPFGDRQIYVAAHDAEREFVHIIASTGVHPDNDHVFDEFSYDEVTEANEWPSIRKLALWGRDVGLSMVLAAAPGEFARRAWLTEYCNERSLSSLNPRRRGGTAQRIAALFIAAGAPVGDGVQRLIDTDERVRAAVEEARLDLAQERELVRESAAQFWFIDVGCTRVTDVALALNALQLPVLVVAEILAHEEPMFARVPCAWIWERVDRVRGRGGAPTLHNDKRRRV
jgi:ankyrin repeat protein